MVPVTTAGRELSLSVTVDGDEIRAHAEFGGAVLSTRAVPVPYGLDTLWTALGLPVDVAEAKLLGVGRRLARSLLDEAALRRLSAEVAAATPDRPLDVVVTAAGTAQLLPYELIRLLDDRVLAVQPFVRLFRRVPVTTPVPVPAPVGPLRVLDVVGPAQLAGALAETGYDVVRLIGPAPPDATGATPADDSHRVAWALGRALRPPPVVILARCIDLAGGDADLAETLIRQGVAHVVALHAPTSMRYAATLAEDVLRGLAEDGLTPAAAVARARAGLFAQAREADEPVRPEYGLAALFSATQVTVRRDPNPTTDVHSLTAADSMDR
jgi:hypothetical protein